MDDMDDIAGVAALNEPVRRALYRFVVDQPAPVTREQVAVGTGVAGHVAKFHLDRLADEGLLTVSRARPAGRRGPGAGRPAKLYRRADQEISVNLPPRRYELVGRILADAVVEAGRSGRSAAETVPTVAESAGRAAAAARPAGSLLEVLAENGFEPRVDPDTIVLRNCPFHRLAAEHTELICGANLHYLRGVLAGLRLDESAAQLAPAAGQCCVTIDAPLPAL